MSRLYPATMLVQPPAERYDNHMLGKVDKKIRFFFERRSTRVYSPGEVGQEQVQKLLAAAMAAPSAAAKNPWHFVVVRNRQTLSGIATALPHGQMLAGAALAIAVCGDLEGCD